jgi:membrane protein DedA with SNARE-associated domain
MSELPVVETVLAFIEANRGWAVAVVALLVLGESVAFLSIAVPATAILLGVGALVGAGVIPFVDVMAAGVAACLLGDAISFGAGRLLGPHTRRVWPFSRHPNLLAQGERVFAEVGVWSVLIGRFFGPLRAVVPLCAGALGMKPGVFALMSAISAPLFLATLIGPTALAAYGLTGDEARWIDMAPVAIPLAIMLAGGWFLMRRFRAAHRIEDEGGLDP